MVFKERFVVVVKCNGKILREVNNTVYLPFGSEYSLLMKNLESRKAKVQVSIDGSDIGNSLVINPNSELELERFLNDLNSGNRFKFIQKTSKIVNHRGDKIDDGIIRVEFQFEKPLPTHVDVYHYHHRSCGSPWCVICNPVQRWTNTPFITYGHQTIGVSQSGISSGLTANVLSSISSPIPEINADEGVTVKGSVSNQKFYHASIGELEENSFVVTLMLRGYVSSGKVKTPVSVKDKLECSVCGTSNKSNSKHCTECGTYLW